MSRFYRQAHPNKRRAKRLRSWQLTKTAWPGTGPGRPQGGNDRAQMERSASVSSRQLWWRAVDWDPAADPWVCCTAAVVLVSRKTGTTPFREADEVFELDAELCRANDAVEVGIALRDRLEGHEFVCVWDFLTTAFAWATILAAQLRCCFEIQ
jgi:hypothetical protein